jgi:Zn-dependent alcohol dehydrogenase
LFGDAVHPTHAVRPVGLQASGLCHTDVLFATHDIVPMPAVLGHEVSGIVAEVGADVTQFRLGDHVVGSLAQSCGWCARCQTGHSFQCQHPEATLRRPTDAPRLTRHGVGLFQGLGLGGFAERVLVHEAIAPTAAPARARSAPLLRRGTIRKMYPDFTIWPSEARRPAHRGCHG